MFAALATTARTRVPSTLRSLPPLPRCAHDAAAAQRHHPRKPSIPSSPTRGARKPRAKDPAPSRQGRPSARPQRPMAPLSVVVPHAGLSVQQLSVLCGAPLARVLSVTRELEPDVTGDGEASLSPALVELVVEALRAPVEVRHQHVSLTGAEQQKKKDDRTRVETGTAGTHGRTPVVTVMGHVDAGKTTLLDALRSTNVAAQEAGGITQSVGAFTVPLAQAERVVGAGRTVTFIDTPGHEAFSAMRAHGAEATDIIVLVVAADDGVMPQTVEAVQHARSAGVPIVVAINKCDKEGADADRARYELLNKTQLNTEQLGGDVQCVEISAKIEVNLDDLVEALLLQAEMLDLRTNPDAPAQGVCLESWVDRRLGSVATMVIRDGTLRTGDCVVYSSLTARSGDLFGRVRNMYDSCGNAIQEAVAGSPVAITGLRDGIQPGASIRVTLSEKEAKTISEDIVNRNREAASTLASIADMERKQAAAKLEAESASLDQSAPATKAAEQKRSTRDESNVESAVKAPVTNIIIRADVHGAAEAVAECVERLSMPEHPFRILLTGAGPVSENDILLGSATRKIQGKNPNIVIAFNTKVSGKASSLARRSSIPVWSHKLIYKLEEELIEYRNATVASRTEHIRAIGVAGVIRVFEDGAIAGCLVQDGTIDVGKQCRVMRLPKDDSSVIRESVHEGEVISIKRFAENMRSIAKGSECGISVKGFTSFIPGDVIECVETVTGGKAAAAASHAKPRSQNKLDKYTR